jgi:hypothetical protein
MHLPAPSSSVLSRKMDFLQGNAPPPHTATTYCDEAKTVQDLYHRYELYGILSLLWKSTDAAVSSKLSCKYDSLQLDILNVT